MITVSPRAHRHEDRAGDPLDGLVNLFDVGVVLAVAFLLAALASLNLTGALSRRSATPPNNVITVAPSDQVSTVPAGGVQTVGRGKKVGTVYRLDNGALVYVLPSSTVTIPAPSATPNPTVTPPATPPATKTGP